MRRPAFWILLAARFTRSRRRRRPLSSPAPSRSSPSTSRWTASMRSPRRGASWRATQLGPADYRQAASFTGDDEAQTFVELEGGGKEAFTRMLREQLYAAYTWRVRQFREGETNETTIQFTPDGKPYGFVERLREDAPGASLDAAAARAIAEGAGTSRWNVDFRDFKLVEQGQERRPAGRVDHTFTYERTSETLKEGRYRLRLVVSGDRLTEVTHFIQNSRSIHPPLRDDAVGERGHRRRLGRRDGPPLCCRRHRRRPVLHDAAAVRAVASGRVLGRGRRTPPDARLGQRVPAAVDDVRHGASALDVHRAAADDDGGRIRRFLRVLRAVVHGRRDADPARVRPASAALARRGRPEVPAASTAILGRTRRRAICWSACSSPTTSCSTWS